MPTRAIPKFSAVKTSFRFASLPLHQAKLPHNNATPSCGKVARKKTTHLAPNVRTPNLEKPVIKRNVEKKSSTTATICVAHKWYTHEKSGKRRRKKLLYAIWKIRRTPKEIRELYRKRFGIETSYRQMNEARIKTCTRDPATRLLFVGIALLLRNVWVWIHFRFAKEKYSAEPELFLELLRFKELLDWITQVVQRALGADRHLGLDRQT